MAPILGILASAQTGNLATIAYDSIATVTVGAGGSGAITFSSIPSTYKHLQLRVFTRGTSGAGGFPTSVYTTFNGDTAGNYSTHGMYGNGANTFVPGGTSTSNFPGAYSPAGTNLANTFGLNILDILDYTNTNKYKTTRLLFGGDFNGSGSVGLISGLWRSTSAITSITLTPDATYMTNFSQYSHLALYGIKG